VLCFRGYHNCSHSMVLLCFVSEVIITKQYHTMRTVMIPSETKHSNTILWEQLWYPRKQSTAIPYYENSYEILGNKAQQYHTMRTDMIPSETEHSDTILWEQLWYPRKQSTAIQYYENSYDTLGNKAQQYHTMRTDMIPSEIKNSYAIISEGIIAVLIIWHCCALLPRVS
jgi:hypothetical protein